MPPVTSVIIPVFNQWNFTRQCLKTLAATTQGKEIEVILVDNASIDATPKAAPFLGKQLFGDKFTFIRNDTNRNFSGATNQGAKAATGEYLVLLNNDTELFPGWLEPLFEDFREFPNLAGTGPLLVYPKSEPFGHTVQHLGVHVTPMLKLDHLYEGIPADSDFARKRRFFQAITAACLMIPRKLFMEIGMLDEAFINGFEDVDLCARLSDKDYKFTVNPQARVIHYQGRSPGRHDNETHNSIRLTDKSMKFLKPDYHSLARADGLDFILTPWLTWRPAIPAMAEKCLDALPKLPYEKLLEIIKEQPFWEGGWKRLLQAPESEICRPALRQKYFDLFHSREMGVQCFKDAIAHRDICSISRLIDILSDSSVTLAKYQVLAGYMINWLASIGLNSLIPQVMKWQSESDRFDKEHFMPIRHEFWKQAQKIRLPLDPLNNNIYSVWINLVEKPARSAKSIPAKGPAFSVLMPVYNPKPEHLRAALDSILAQTYPNWELCAADDASTSSEIWPILQEYAARDKRIHITRRETNGGISAATNTALEMAHNPWSALLDQDDTLSHDALAIMAEAIRNNPDAELFYSDEDKLDKDGFRFFPYFKGNWDPELVLAQNFVCHLGVYRTQRLKDIDGFRLGYEGAQDHDMLLRFTENLLPQKIIHIPHILYHWRAHEQSTALNSSVKSDAGDNGLKATQNWLDRNMPGAVAELFSTTWRRIKYPIPKDKPGVTIICDMGDSHKNAAAFIHKWNSDYPHEILILSDDERQAFPAGAALMKPPAALKGAARFGWAAEQAKTEIVAFVAQDIFPGGGNWLEEMVSCLWRPGVGVCSGKILLENNRFLDAGYAFDASGLLKPIFRNASNQDRWYGWSYLTRTVDAVNGACLFTRRNEFLECFNSKIGFAAFCLCLKKKGLRSVWNPFAIFQKTGGMTDRMQNIMLESAEPFNANLLAGSERLTLCTN